MNRTSGLNLAGGSLLVTISDGGEQHLLLTGERHKTKGTEEIVQETILWQANQASGWRSTHPAPRYHGEETQEIPSG